MPKSCTKQPAHTQKDLPSPMILKEKLKLPVLHTTAMPMHKRIVFRNEMYIPSKSLSLLGSNSV